MRIGLALGGGGAKGLAHIPMLEVFDELGIRPYRLAGTSIGAIMGAIYASGIRGARIRERVERMVVTRGDSFRDILHKRDALRWIEFLDLDIGHGGLFKGDRFIAFLFEAMQAETFEDLAIPLKVVATDFWASAPVVLETGNLPQAVKASMGLPGVFTPVIRDGRVLIDGGGVNPLPYDLLDDCDAIVAIDVMGTHQPGRHPAPNLLRAVLGTFDIMQNSIIAAKLAHRPPTLYIRPDIQDIDLLDFFRADEIYRQAAPAQRRLREGLEALLNGIPAG